MGVLDCTKEDDEGRSRRIWIWPLLVLVLLVGILCLLPPQEPRFDGKPLSLWLEAFYAPSRPLDFAKANEAVRHIGSNALPWLVTMVQTKDTPLKTKLISLLSKQSLVRLRLTPAETLHIRAAHAFRALGPQARPAVPRLAALLKDPDVSPTAAYCLGLIDIESVPWLTAASKDPDSRIRAGIARAATAFDDRGKTAMVPVLLPLLEDPDADVRSAAAWYLASNKKEPAIVVPLLIERLNDTNDTVRVNAISGLGEFGRESASALPHLKQGMADPDWSIRIACTNAFSRIERELASR